MRLEATMSETPRGSWSRRYSSSADSGSIEMWCSPSATARSTKTACVPAPASVRLTSSRAATSATIVRSPRAAAATPSAAATVDLPTPPFPVTTSSGLGRRACIGPRAQYPRPAPGLLLVVPVAAGLEASDDADPAQVHLAGVGVEADVVGL